MYYLSLPQSLAKVIIVLGVESLCNDIFHLTNTASPMAAQQCNGHKIAEEEKVWLHLHALYQSQLYR